MVERMDEWMDEKGSSVVQCKGWVNGWIDEGWSVDKSEEWWK
jgi:hypothetical protein